MRRCLYLKISVDEALRIVSLLRDLFLGVNEEVLRLGDDDEVRDFTAGVANRPYKGS